MRNGKANPMHYLKYVTKYVSFLVPVLFPIPANIGWLWELVVLSNSYSILANLRHVKKFNVEDVSQINSENKYVYGEIVGFTAT